MKSTSAGGHTLKDFFTFKRMLTPVLIMILFWIGVVVSVVMGFTFIIDGLDRGRGEPMFMGLVVLLGGPLTIRIYCELLIVVFRINETLTEINNKTR